MIKVFSSDKIVWLVDNKQKFKHLSGTILISVSSEKEMRTFYRELIANKDLKEIFFYNEDMNVLFDHFKSMFKLIEAAGGIVKNEKNEYLFIFRNGKWDLPKGKVEKNEAVDVAAIREVEEECGVSKLTILQKHSTTYHTYFIGDQAILKPTHWFDMRCDDTSKLVPQIEEGITDVRWIAAKDLAPVKENTYDSIRDIVDVLITNVLGL